MRNGRIPIFGKEVKKKLVDMGKTQEWLIAEVRKKTGLYFDSSYMYKIQTGQLTTPKITQAIQEILKL